VISAIKFDRQHGTHTEQKVAAAVQQVKYMAIQHANKDRMVSADTDGQNQGPMRSQAGARQQATRQIVINLNKPMIDTFIINTKDGKEGLSDFKRKVEEVLIEILTSANVI
jgi:hypothetical protein